jgi:hypothetical protein
VTRPASQPQRGAEHASRLGQDGHRQQRRLKLRVWRYKAAGMSPVLGGSGASAIRRVSPQTPPAAVSTSPRVRRPAAAVSPHASAPTPPLIVDLTVTLVIDTTCSGFEITAFRSPRRYAHINRGLARPGMLSAVKLLSWTSQRAACPPEQAVGHAWAVSHLRPAPASGTPNKRVNGLVDQTRLGITSGLERAGPGGRVRALPDPARQWEELDAEADGAPRVRPARHRRVILGKSVGAARRRRSR